MKAGASQVAGRCDEDQLSEMIESGHAIIKAIDIEQRGTKDEGVEGRREQGEEESAIEGDVGREAALEETGAEVDPTKRAILWKERGEVGVLKKSMDSSRVSLRWEVRSSEQVEARASWEAVGRWRGTSERRMSQGRKGSDDIYSSAPGSREILGRH